MHVLRAGQVFDGERFRGSSDVVVDDATVLAVTEPGAYAAHVTIDDLGPDATILPGLIDAHSHLTWDCSTDPVGWFSGRDDAAILDRARDNARVALAAGITTVRDLGGRGRVALDLRAECAADPLAGPTLLVSGAPLTTRGGHCWFLGGEAEGPKELRAAAAYQIDEGVDVVKVMATGGNVTPGSAPHESQFTVDMLRAVTELAHAAGVPVAAHAHGVDGVRDAVTAGVDTIEHGTFLTPDGVADDPALVDRLAATGLPVVLTSGTVPGGAPPPELAARMPLLVAHVRRLLDRGVVWVLSTDAGVGPQKPHDVLPWALPQALQMGASTERALSACTSRAAEALGIGAVAGRLAPGRPADLLAVAGRVDRDPTALCQPIRVLRAGARVR